MIPAGVKPGSYRFDLYQPILRQAQDDSLEARPLVIWMHGGGFKFGSKKIKGIRVWSKSFARRGYVCAAINYRLSKKKPLRNFNALADACYDAVQDVTKAIQYFKRNASIYRIDTSKIILAGNSAGAIIALHAAYSSNAGLRAVSKKGDTSFQSISYNPSGIAAVINFWGALFDTAFLQNTSVPIVSVHGTKDRIVPYNDNGSSLYGSEIIHRRAMLLRIPNSLKAYIGYGHELQKHFIPILRSGRTKKRWLDAGQFAADFLYEQLLK